MIEEEEPAPAKLILRTADSYAHAKQIADAEGWKQVEWIYYGKAETILGARREKIKKHIIVCADIPNSVVQRFADWCWA